MTKKQVIRVISFLCILSIVLIGLSRIFAFPVDVDSRNYVGRFNEYYQEDENKWDGILIGTSVIDRAWVAPKAWNEYGMTLYPMSTDGQSIALTTFIIEEVRKTQDLDLVVIDLHGIRSSVFAFKEHRIRRVTDNMKNSWNRLKAINYALDYYERFLEENGKDSSKINKLSYYVPFVKYHSRWLTGLNEEDFKSPISEMKGVYQKFAFKPAAQKEYEYTAETKELTQIQYDVLQDIIDYGKKNNINYLFTNVPSELSDSEQMEINEAMRIVEQAGYQTVNFNTKEMTELVGIDFETDFYNPDHVNSKGALKVTNYLAKYISENFDMEDHRGNPEYKSWDEAYSEYTQYYKNGWEKKK